MDWLQERLWHGTTFLDQSNSQCNRCSSQYLKSCHKWHEERQSIFIKQWERNGENENERGIFQGNSFSLLLFVIAMLPLTMTLRERDAGFRFSGVREKVKHLLFMDDLKPYGRNESEPERLVGIVKGYSGGIGIRFLLGKCGALVIEKDVKEKSSDWVTQWRKR